MKKEQILKLLLITFLFFEASRIVLPLLLRLQAKKLKKDSQNIEIFVAARSFPLLLLHLSFSLLFYDTCLPLFRLPVCFVRCLLPLDFSSSSFFLIFCPFYTRTLLLHTPGRKLVAAREKKENSISFIISMLFSRAHSFVLFAHALFLGCQKITCTRTRFATHKGEKKEKKNGRTNASD